MYNTYIASTVFSLGTKGYLSFSYNDCSAFLNDRFDRFPLLVSAPSSSSHCCSCCCSNCCSNSCCSASSSPSSSFAARPHRLLYGLRQSSLIQWSPWRRPILVGLGGTGEKRVYCRVPGYEFNQGCYEVSCSFKGRSDGVERIERRRNERFRSLNSSRRRCLGGVDEVDAVISLLSEDYLGGGEERVGTERRENYGREFQSGRRREKIELGLGKGDSKYESESVKEQVRGGGYNRRKKERKEGEEKEQGEEKEAVSRSENHRATESSSSFSSYYSLASAEDYESDKGAEDDYVVVVDDSSIRHRKDSWSEEDIFDGQVVEFRGKGDDVERDGRLPGRRTAATRTGIELDSKKKSDKKLAEIEEAQSRTESSQMHSRMGRVHEIDSKKASSSYKHIDDEEEKSNLAVDLEKGMRKHHRQMGQQFEVTRNYRETADLQEVHGRNVRTTSQDQKHFSGREENQKVATDFVWERKKDKRSSQQLTEISEIENVNSERVFNLQRNSESRMKILEEDTASTSVQETFLQHQQRAQRVGGQIESRRSAQHSTEISKIDDSSSQRISNLQPDGTNKQQESTSVVYSSSKETTEQRSQTDQMYIQSRKRSQDLTNISVNVTNVSVVHPGNVETASSSRQTSGMRMVDQGDELIPVVKPIKETRERKSPTFESATRVKSQNEGHKAIKVPSFHERTSQEASGSETSVQLNSQATMQQINVNEVDKRNTEMVMMAPSPQLIARGSVRVDPTVRMTMPYDSAENSGGGSGAMYTNAGGRSPASHQESYGRERSGEIYEELHPGDALGSAHLSEESSMQFVGEFVDRARHELSTSEAQEEVTVSDVELLHEGEKLRKKSLGQHGSEDIKLKGLDSRKSSGASGTKGPSDEMWHVMEPAVQEPPETETLEDKHETRNLVVKRTGRSLWSIMVDIVRLRFGSRPEIPNSAARSGGKSSSNDSASSEAWFSGHDPDENSEENAKRERRSISKEAASFHQPQLGRAPSQAWSEASDTYGSKDKIGRLDKDMPSPSIAPKSGSKSKGTSTPADDEDIGLIQGGKHSEAAPFHQPQLGHTSSQVQSKTSDTNGSKEKMKHLDTDSPSPSIALESGSTSKRISTAEDESISLIQGKIASSSTEVGEISLPLYSGGIHGHIIEGSSIGKTDAFGRGSMEPIEQPVIPESSEVQGSEEKNIELRQRKLQRNKQVTRDRFEEWEEAHIQETEQRKIDEMFMREALIEAKKAADTWEVPVGAVLVQHGKIIARGCNLVEELRDSTAHAEMICIREASNKLRSWRLAETTLYVTLEPCPMCAGAILQARIDTVVWGAPNKLLGADGSWIRLFPDGEVGGNGSESTDKPAAPIHPFHPKMTIRRGILASECADTMQQFFQLRRRKKDENVDQPPQSSSLAFPHHQSKILKKMHDIFHVMFCL